MWKDGNEAKIINIFY